MRHDLIEFFSAKRLFVTGGTGFFGKSLLSFLLDNPLPYREICLLSRNPERFRKEFPEFTPLKNLSFQAGDVRNFTFPEKDYDHLLHFGAPSHSVPERETNDIIIRGTKRILEFALARGIGKILYASSGGVYGPQPENVERIPETAPARPSTPYGQAKLEAERHILDSGIPSVIARGFAFTGPYLPKDAHFAIGNFIADVLAGREILIRGDGTAIRSYMDYRDLAEWLLVLLAAGRGGGIYNVGSESGISVRELAEKVNSVLGGKSRIRILGKNIPGAGVSRYLPDTRAAREELNLSEHISLSEAILASAGME